MNIGERKLFVPCYKDNIESIYCNLIEENFSEKRKRRILKEIKDEEFRGGFYNSFLSSLKTLFGSTNAKLGYFYEKRMYAIFKTLKELKINTKSEIYTEKLLEELEITDYIKSEEFSKIVGIKLSLPKVVFNELPNLSKTMYYDKGDTRKIFTNGLQRIFKLMNEHFEEDIIIYERDIDHCIKKDNKIFLVESKTIDRKQPHNAYDDVKKFLETWAGLTYILLKKSRLSENSIKVEWNTISLIYIMNELTPKEVVKYVKYFPLFYSNNLNKGGVLSGEEFYWYFFGVDYDDILAVEKYLSEYVAHHAITLINDLKKTLKSSIKSANEEFNTYIENISE